MSGVVGNTHRNGETRRSQVLTCFCETILQRLRVLEGKVTQQRRLTASRVTQDHYLLIAGDDLCQFEHPAFHVLACLPKAHQELLALVLQLLRGKSSDSEFGL